MSRTISLVKTRISKPYVQRVVMINRRSVKQFIRPEWHREFREAHINTIRRALLGGTHPSENITVNSKNGSGYRIINGNHRIEAIRRVIKEHPTFSIELTITVYHNLKRTDEIEIYEKVNNTRKETGLDRLKAHLTGTEIYELLASKFPSRVVFRNISRAERNVISAATVLSSYVCRNDSAITRSMKEIIAKAKTLDETDYNRLARFMRLFKRVFGEPSKENLYSGYNVYSVFAKLYYTLVGTDLTEDQFETRARRIMSRHTTQLVFFNKGIDKQPELYTFVHGKMGKHLFSAVRR